MIKNQSSQALSPEEKRTEILNAKVTASQKERICTTARKCGMSTSDFILARCFNYRPKLRLTPEQEVLLKPLVEVRADLRHFFAAYNGMPQKERIILLQTAPVVYEWATLLAEMGNQLNDVLQSLQARNELPPAVQKTTEP